jgi:phospholipid transport system substrate-binding protein
MRSQARIALLVVAGLVALLAAPAVGAETPTEQLRAHVARALKILEDPAFKAESRAAARQAEIRKVAADIFDFTEMTRRALGPHWQPRTPAERQEMVALFTDLLERSYVSKIEMYSGERIVWAGEAIDGDQATIRTRIVTKQGTEVPVDYRMARRGDRWVAYDVSIEGVSLVANYRTQFNKIIQTSSYAELVKRLRDKLDERPAAADSKVKRTSVN